MTALRNSSFTTFAIALFAMAGLAVVAPVAVAPLVASPSASASHIASSPIADFVDCSDSFWAVACEEDPEWGDAVNIELGQRVRIDSDVTCEPFGTEFIICHT